MVELFVWEFGLAVQVCALEEIWVLYVQDEQGGWFVLWEGLQFFESQFLGHLDCAISSYYPYFTYITNYYNNNIYA